MFPRFVGTTHRSLAAGVMPALVVGVLLCAASRSSAQAPAPPSVSVGAGVQASFVHDSPDGGDATDTFPLNSVRLYVSGTVAPKIKFMFNTEYDGRATTSPCWMRRRSSRSRPSSTSGWAACFRRATAPTCTDRTTRTTGRSYHRRRPGRLSVVGLPGAHGPRQRRDVLGPVRQGQAVGRRLRRRVGDGQHDGHRRRTRPGRLLGSGRRLLPERHLLRRQEPARHRRRGTGAGERQVGLRASTSSSRRRWRAAARSPIESEYAKYGKLGGYNARYAESDGGYVLASFLFPPAMGMPASSRSSASSRKANFSKGLSAVDPDYDQKTTEFNFNYIIKEFNARVMIFYKDTRFNAVQTELQAVRRRPAAADVTRDATARAHVLAFFSFIEGVEP